MPQDKKPVSLWLLGLLTVFVYLVNLFVLGYFTFSHIDAMPSLLIIFLVGVGSSTVLTGLVYYSILRTQEKIESITSKIGHAKELTSDVQTHLKILSSLLRIGTLHSHNIEMSKLLNNIVKVIQETLDADRVSLMLLDKNDNRLYTKAVAGEYGPEAEHIKKAALEIGDGVAGYVFAKAKPLLVDKNTDFSKFNRYIPKLGPLSSAMCVPLHIGTQMLGVININRLKTTNKLCFDQRDLMLLTIFAEDIAVTIENAYLTRELKKAKALSEISIRTDEVVVSPAVPVKLTDSKIIKRPQPIVVNNITTQKLQDNIMAISIKGVLDHQMLEQLEQTISKLFSQGLTNIIVNLSDVDRISSEGIGFFTSLIHSLERKSGKLVLVKPNQQVKTAMTLFGLQELFPIVDDISSALKSIESPSGT
jgi:anti-anti-sigma factor